jgi:cell division septum initiation protein DivIVA
MPMPLDEARQVRLEAKRGRYDQRAVDRYVASLLEGWEGAVRERDELRSRVRSLEAELKNVRGLEHDLRDMLLAAQRVGKELRDSGERERDEIVRAAHEEATRFRQAMASERERVEAEIRRLRDVETQMKTGYKQFLAAALELLEDATGERESAQAGNVRTFVRTGAGENG